jgi:hypothetical protein
MRRLIYLVAILLTLALTPKSHTQVRLVTTSARPKNTYKLVQSFQEYNKAAGEFNAQFNQYKTCWEIKPEQLLTHVQKMREELDKTESLLPHLDEAEP